MTSEFRRLFPAKIRPDGSNDKSRLYKLVFSEDQDKIVAKASDETINLSMRKQFSSIRNKTSLDKSLREKDLRLDLAYVYQQQILTKIPTVSSVKNFAWGGGALLQEAPHDSLKQGITTTRQRCRTQLDLRPANDRSASHHRSLSNQKNESSGVRDLLNQTTGKKIRGANDTHNG